jgi:tetraacyldisaccharide 4'-kinase
VLAGLDLAGDEPLMLARAVPGAIVVVCEDRRVAGALAERHLGATVHVLDDGFQHWAVARDIDLVLVSPDDLTARAFPFGPLRESPRALAYADAVIVDTDTTGGMFGVRRSLRPPASPDGQTWTPDRGPVVALAGIARPARFRDALEAAGWRVAELVAFRDHHRYTSRDVARVNATARRAGAAGIVTTAKDAVRLPEGAAWAAPLAVARLEAEVTPGDRFRAWLLERLSEARR